MGHEVFPDLDKSKDEDEIERRFRAGVFPTDACVCAAITAKCWKQLYSSASQVLTDLEAVRETVARGEAPDSVSDGHDPPPATSWLSGLCDDAQRLKVPPPYRQLVGFD